MTDKDLGAKVAEVRGEKCDYHGQVLYHTKSINPDNGNITLHPTPKAYATDLNVAKELKTEMYDSRSEPTPLTVMHTPSSKYGPYVLTFRSTRYEPASTECRAVCKAYIKWKEDLDE